MGNKVKQVAEVTLSPGIVAWYDKLTNIYLTEQNPSEKIYNYMNTSNIRNAIKNKIIILSKGYLDFRRVPKNVEEIEAKYKTNSKNLESKEAINTTVNMDIEEPSIVNEYDLVSEQVVINEPVVEEIPKEESNIETTVKPKKAKKASKKNPKNDEEVKADK